MAQEFNIAQIKEITKFSLEASKNKIKLPLCYWGVHGTGKTELVKQIAEELDYNIVILHLAMQDICDLIGIPAKQEVEINGNTQVMQTWACPQWLHEANENYKKTKKPNLFFLDEMNRANRFVLSAMLPFLIEGILHTHRIGPEDAVIAAANPANEKYEVNEIIDEALLNRLGHVIFKPTHSEYIAFLKRQGVDSTTIKVAKNNPSYTKIADFDLGFDVKPSRRSIFNIMSVIGKKNKKWISEHASYVIEAYLGSAFRDEWLTEYNSKDESITIDMLKDFDNNKHDIEAAITTTIDNVITHRTDILSKTLDIIKTYIKDNVNTLTAIDFDWMIKFFNIPIIPDDASAAVFMSNSDVRKLILKDTEINIKLVNFLRSKKIVIDNSISPWLSESDKI